MTIIIIMVIKLPNLWVDSGSVTLSAAPLLVATLAQKVSLEVAVNS